MNWDVVRREFPALENWTYLNTATFGQMPRCGMEAAARHFTHRDELACWDFIQWFDDMDAVRASIGRLVTCAPEDVAFISNAAAALAILISGIQWEPGDRVVTLRDEFPNNLYALGALSSRGVEAIEASWDQFYESINEQTRLVAISSVSYATGFVPPLEEISAFLRARGVLLFIDGTQSVGAMRFDISRVQPDMLAVHGYKWLLCPNGAGFMYVRPELRESLLPNVIGWRSHHDWRSVDQLHHGVPELSAAAEKYEGGMLPFALIYAMGAAVDMILEIGPYAIEARTLDLADRARELLRARGASVPSYKSPIVAARFEGEDVSDMARSLKEQRILVAARHGNLRVSPHFYNNEEDLEILSTAIGRTPVNSI
jgi:cysteine desulfurase / selenocysteine lyase